MSLNTIALTPPVGKVRLSFTRVTDSRDVEIYEYSPSLEAQEEIISCLDSKVQELILMFGRFRIFDPDKHLKPLQYAFETLPKEITSHRCKDLENNTLMFKKDCENWTSDVPETELLMSMTKKETIFICKLLHHIDIKRYLVAMAKFAMKKFGLEFDELKVLIKNDKHDRYKLTKYSKNML